MSMQDSEKALKDAVEELTAARDAARVKAHLFSMDAKKTWDELEGKVQELREKMENQGERMAESSALAARDLAQSIRKFVEKHL